MECLTCRDNLTAYLDKELSSKDQDLADQHLRQCAGCSAEFESLSRFYWMVNNTLEEIEVRPETWTRIEAAIGVQSGTRSWRDFFASFFQSPSHALVAASFGVVLLVAFVLVFQSRQPNDPALESLSPQLNSMVQEMDKREGDGHNLILSPTEDESQSNPFAVRHVSSERNPFRTEPITRDLWLESAPRDGNANFETRDTK